MKIAIQGHPTRGKEVIQILESLGGRNFHEWHGNGTTQDGFFIDTDSIIKFDKLPKGYKLYTLEEFEKEFPFKVGDTVQTKSCGEPAKIIRLYPNPACTIVYNIRYASGAEMLCSTHNIKLYKEMKKERNITLTLDKAKEWYKKGGELREIALQAFTENELNSLPKSWEEYCKRYEIPIMMLGINIPDKYVVLWKLEQLRDCYRQGWKPDWKNLTETKYCITLESDALIIRTHGYLNEFLSFQSVEIAREFLKNFEPLIKEAGDLI